MLEPLVSVAVPSYNHAAFIEDCINSIIAQDYKNIELIIIDDGSRDDTFEKLNLLKERCELRFVRFEVRFRENRGLCNTLNEALEWASGDFFSPSASDDILFPNKIASQVKCFNEQRSRGVVGVLAGISIFGARGFFKIEKGSDSLISFKEVFLRSVRLPGQATMLDTQKLKDIGGYNPQFKVEDLNVFLRLTKNGGMLFSMSTPLIHYRRHEDNLSSKHELMWEAIFKTLSQYNDDPLFQKAIASSMLIQAHSLQRESSSLALLWARKALQAYPWIVLSPSFIKLLMKFILPKKIINFFKRINK